MTQVARGVGPGAASRPGIALPVRIHDLLLTMAGRLDDDALADARQMLASAELDRSLEFLAGCLVAGRVVLTHDQHAELASLFADTFLDPSVIDRIMVTDRMNIGRHRFAFGSVDGREPERGVADAVRPVLGVLPDVRSMWCVWRLSPAGPASGPVPHLLVLVGIGPGGFAPATTYRVEEALRRNGIRASVEVLMDGVEPGEYHKEAMRNARQIPFDGPGFNRPRVEPAYEAARIAPARVEAPRMAPAPEPPRLEPARVTAVPQEHVEPPRVEPQERPEPPRVEPVRMSVVPDLPPPVDAPRIDASEVPVRKDPPFSDAPAGEPARVDPPTMMSPATGGLIGGEEDYSAQEQTRVDPPLPETPRVPLPEASRVPLPEAPRVEAVRTDPFQGPPAEPTPLPSRPVEPAPDEPVGMQEDHEPRTASRPAPPLPRRREEPPQQQEPPSRPRLAPAPAPTGGVDKHSQAFVDDILNTQERNLLKELQDELARREQQDPPPQQGGSGSWRVDRSGRHGKPGQFEHPNQTTGPMIINGVPPHERGYPPAN